MPFFGYTFDDIVAGAENAAVNLTTGKLSADQIADLQRQQTADLILAGASQDEIAVANQQLTEFVDTYEGGNGTQAIQHDGLFKAILASPGGQGVATGFAIGSTTLILVLLLVAVIRWEK